MIGAIWARFSLILWLLEEGGANITDVIILSSKAEAMWDNMLVAAANMEVVPLLKVMVLLGDALPNFIARLSPSDAEIAI
jgi:hypothetical protein